MLRRYELRYHYIFIVHAVRRHYLCPVRKGFKKMALVKSELKATIKDALTANQGNTDNTDAAMDALAQAIADAVAVAVDQYVTTATVTNVPVLTSPSGPVTGTITTTIVGTIA